MTLFELQKDVAKIMSDALGSDVDGSQLELTRSSDAKFGDFSTNAALVYAKDLGKKPRDLAHELVAALRGNLTGVKSVEIAGPGFINFSLNDEALAGMAMAAARFRPDSYTGKRVVVEYSDPSSFKVLHAGHLYTSVVGDSIAKLIESARGIVYRVNFGGDIGLHVAKTMWAILKELGGENPDRLRQVPIAERAEWMSERYVEGNAAYDDSDEAKQQIAEYNKRLYGIFDARDKESAFARVYWTCRQWSYDYFDAFYARIGVHFDKYYPESETAPVGLKTVKEELRKGVYENSDGAVVFHGEKYGLHTRVFINSQGLPTYETKDVGLSIMKWDDYHFNKSIILTDSQQEEYMAVVLKSIEQFEPKLARTTVHITHGRVKLAGGVKMSSRMGNIVRAVEVLDLAQKANTELTGNNDERVVLGAVKYAFLKSRIGSDVTYAPDESVALDGNSGPYLQYAHARARSILGKVEIQKSVEIHDLEQGERILAAKIGEYPEVLQKSVDELMPHHIATYLYEMAQVFNRFYEANRVVGDKREQLRARLVSSYAEVLKHGLGLLGIEAPTKL